MMLNISNTTNDTNNYDVYASKEDVKFYHILFGLMILLSLYGYPLREAGLARAKNATAILTRSSLCIVTSFLAFWFIGYGLAFGKGNYLVGFSNFTMDQLEEDRISFTFLHSIIAIVPAIIATNAMAERAYLQAYISTSFFVSGFIYPIFVHWIYTTEGWLNRRYVFKAELWDYGGSTYIYASASSVSLIATLLLNPRMEAFDPISKKKKEINGHSMILLGIGNNMILFGMLLINIVGQYYIDNMDPMASLGRSAMNSMLSSSIAFITSIFLFKASKQKVPLIHFASSAAMAGMVTVAAGCNAMPQWGALVAGISGATICTGIQHLVTCLRIDDPLNCISINLFTGFWGIILGSFFNQDSNTEYGEYTPSQLAINVTGACAIIGASLLFGLIQFALLKSCKVLRISPSIEMDGFDVTWYGGNAYPFQSDNEMFYQRNYDHGVSLSRQNLCDSRTSLQSEAFHRTDLKRQPYVITGARYANNINGYLLPRIEVPKPQQPTTKL